MRKLLLLIALLLIATAVRGQQSTLIQNVSGRSPISPDGQWKVMVDTILAVRTTAWIPARQHTDSAFSRVGLSLWGRTDSFLSIPAPHRGHPPHG
jgi:hypothetical protein